MDKKDKDIIKLSKLLIHWANHNDSHKESFIKWCDIAKSKELTNVTEDLEKAIEKMDECNTFLLKAHKKIGLE